ncbi:L-rhamnose mutarotase [Colwellia demingiae]|uniref:L-rhamnose mutarotase n=1 Tax=Colwellia demingiae TaxID=89401 RepID=A0A5C6QDN7_9GAMM|nr:L-rhamnose mutarotase [Colwellia demingiae]TWX66858.1 L-rhamnose mutarotase [Colwellia demingiae]
MQYCLTLALKNDPELIKLYEAYHQAGRVWPEVIKSIRASGIKDMSIYRLNTHLVMILDVDKSFNFDIKAKSDLNNEKVQEWELLMEKFQKVADGRENNKKWKLMDKIFSLHEQ